MNLIFPAVLVAAITAVSVSCAPKAQVPAPQKVIAAAPSVPKKPVRMNGRGTVSSISLTEAFSLQQTGQAYLIDARPRIFYALGHLPGAISLPKAGCAAQIAKRESEIKAALAAKQTLIVYCTNTACPDARGVATHLADFGYSSSTLQGGWDGWKEAGLPTE